MSHTILLVDADEPTTALLAEQLAADGYRAVVAHSIDAVHAVAAPAAPDVVVLGDLGHTLGLLDDVRAGGPPTRWSGKSRRPRAACGFIRRACGLGEPEMEDGELRTS
jgi:hypothetical protein